MGRNVLSILVVTPDYPFESETNYPFVRTLCEEFVRKGHKVTVLCPQSITSTILHGKLRRPTVRYDAIDEKSITVYQPYYITVPTRFHDINNWLIRIGLKLFFLKNVLKPDVCYCHFWSSGFAILPFAKKRHIPLYVATGESDIHSLFSTRFGFELLRSYVTGVICVSSKNRDESVELGLTTIEKCKVFPNAVNAEFFHRCDRSECRKQLGLPLDDFIVVFVGWFIERKGPQRVAAAINMLNGVKSVFIGKGEQAPQCKGILFKGALPHEEVPIYLGAADVFVLPTLHEGCCNAVVEAMSCGLPVISSNLPFNWDVLNENNSIMIDPNNVEQIADAIRTLKDNPQKRAELAEGALKTAESLTIDRRAAAILHFLSGGIK